GHIRYLGLLWLSMSHHLKRFLAPFMPANAKLKGGPCGTPTNLLPAIAASIAGTSWWLILDLHKYPAAPSLIADCTMSGSVFWDRKSIFDWGAIERICAAASNPFNLGI